MPIVLTILLFGITLVYATQNWAAESDVPIYKGWNLVYGFLSPEQLEGQGFASSHIKAVYGFIPQNQEYLRLYPNPVEKEKAINQLSQQAFWVYSDETVSGELNGISHATEYWLYNTPATINQRELSAGWNFFANTPEVFGESFNEIKGTCNIEKSYGWDPTTQQWVNFPLDEDFIKEAPNLGFVIKVSNTCKLGVSEGTASSIPNLPQ